MWRVEANLSLFLATTEQNNEERTKLVLEFAAYEVLARLAHILQQSETGHFEWPEHVDIRVIHTAIEEIIGSISLRLIVNVDADQIGSRADILLYEQKHFVSQRAG